MHATEDDAQGAPLGRSRLPIRIRVCHAHREQVPLSATAASTCMHQLTSLWQLEAVATWCCGDHSFTMHRVVSFLRRSSVPGWHMRTISEPVEAFIPCPGVQG